jgi:hypothetical protein
MDSNCTCIAAPRSLISEAILGGISLFNVRTLVQSARTKLDPRDVYLWREKILCKVSLTILL